MIPISFDQQTGVLKGGEFHHDVPFYRQGKRIVTKWKLNKEELEEIAKTGFLWIHMNGSMWHPITPSGFDPFKPLEPLVAMPGINAMLYLIDNEEIIVLQVKEGEVNFHAVTEDDEWWHLVFKIHGDVDKKWHRANYSFKEQVEVIGLANDCPEYWWVLPELKVQKEQVLFLKRVKNHE